MMKSEALAPSAFDPFHSETVPKPVAAEPLSRRRKRRADQREFKVTVAFLTALFLPCAAVARIIPGAWRPFARSRSAPLSVFGQAKAAANEIAPFMLSR